MSRVPKIYDDFIKCQNTVGIRLCVTSRAQAPFVMQKFFLQIDQKIATENFKSILSLVLEIF